jgi:two-component system sensor histidine kinase KdpD
MSISSRITYVPAQDLLEEDTPTRRAPRQSVSRRRQLAGLALAAVGLPLLTLLLDHTSSLSIEGDVLLYLLAVVAVALVGGVVVALAAAAAAALLINYYFVRPLHTFDIAHTDQAVALGVFVIVAVVVSGTVELATRRTRAAELAVAQAETLSALAGSDLEVQDTLATVLDRARHTFNMESVVLKHRDHATGTWNDVETAGWGVREALQFDVPITHDLRLLGRGPALFAEDQRVLHAFAAAAQTAYEGRRLSVKAQEGRELATVNRERTALLAAVGHDLLAPLAAFRAGATALRQADGQWPQADRDELVTAIDHSADRLDGIVTNLLDASRLQAGAVLVRAEPVALDEVIAAALLAVPGDADAVHLDLAQDLPLVMADPDLLERVLVNIVDTAVRRDGGRIDVWATAGVEHVKVTVVDHGPGAPDQGEPPDGADDAGAIPGVGLGFFVARGFAEAMGAALVVDRSSDGGLTMRLRLPVAKPG